MTTASQPPRIPQLKAKCEDLTQTQFQQVRRSRSASHPVTVAILSSGGKASTGPSAAGGYYADAPDNFQGFVVSQTG